MAVLGTLANGSPNPLTIGNDFVMEGDMGIDGGAGLTFSGNMLIGNRDRYNGGTDPTQANPNYGYRNLYTSGNVTLSGSLISTNVWSANN